MLDTARQIYFEHSRCRLWSMEAKEQFLCGLRDFNLEGVSATVSEAQDLMLICFNRYEKSERVDVGD